MTGCPSLGTQRVSFFFLKFSFSMWNGDPSHGPYAGEGIKARDWNRMDRGKGVVFCCLQQKQKWKPPPCCLLPGTSCKLPPSVFICIVYELPIYLFAAPASLLLQRCGNKMIIYRLLNACFAGPERWISRSRLNWQSSGSVIEEAGGGRAIYIHLIRSSGERIPSPGSMQRITIWFHGGNFNQGHSVQRCAHSAWLQMRMCWAVAFRDNRVQLFILQKQQ